MKHLLLLLIIFPAIIFAQKKDTIVLSQNPPQRAQFICRWGDPKKMELHPNGIIYQFKEGLENGKYTAFFDKSLKKDTALIVVIKNGKVNGLLRRWDNDDFTLAEEAEYKDGKLHGYRKLYFISPDGKRLTNIERWENNVHQEDLQLEW